MTGKIYKYTTNLNWGQEKRGKQWGKTIWKIKPKIKVNKIKVNKKIIIIIVNLKIKWNFAKKNIVELQKKR